MARGSISLGFHSIQAFLNFIAMACFAKVADFQARWGIGPCEPQPVNGRGSSRLTFSFPIAELSTAAVVSSVIGLVLSLYCIQLNSTKPTTPLSPLAYLLDFGHGLLCAAAMACLHGVVGCVRFCSGMSHFSESGIHRVATTVSAFTQPGCRNPQADPHRQLGPRFQGQLRGWCNTKKAGSIFVCFVFGELGQLQ